MNSLIFKRLKENLHLIAIVFFFSGSALSLYLLLKEGINFNPTYIIHIIVLSAAFVGLSLLRFKLSGQLFGVPISYRDSAQIIAASTFANLLPVPGGLVIKFNHIRKKSDYKKGLLSQVIVICIWVLVCILFLSLLTSKAVSIFLVTASALVATALFATVTRKKLSRKTFIAMLLTQTFLTGINISRIWLIFLCLGISTDIKLPIALTVSNALVSAGSITPGGIGVSEGISSLLSKEIIDNAAAGFAATSLNRMSTWLILASILTIFFFRGKKRNA